MTKQEQVKAIFIEEAGEIIEKLDVDILRFEDSSSDFDLLNEIFRGVHTLKGNANAFGFTRLGEFVHHFEDVLDHYRSTQETIETSILELIVNSVDVIQEVMVCELDAITDLPDQYGVCLDGIKMLIASKRNRMVQAVESSTMGLADLSSEFGFEYGNQLENLIRESIIVMRAEHEVGMELY
ncbi:MAG: Hpt domain-containing protein, partial [Sulfuricurvum sp.]